MVACTPEEFPQPPNGEHPVTAVLAVIAIIAAILLITWARFEILGTSDLVAAVTEDGPTAPQPDHRPELDAAVTSNRFATGVSPH